MSGIFDSTMQALRERLSRRWWVSSVSVQYLRILRAVFAGFLKAARNEESSLPLTVQAPTLQQKLEQATLNISEIDSDDSAFLEHEVPPLKALDIPACFCNKGEFCAKH